MCVALSAVAAVEAQAGTPLWRTLNEGDAPEDVKEKLEAMPEVERVKNITRKGSFSKQDINMAEGGVPIFDGHFSVGTGFLGQSLSTVSLVSGEGCARDSYALASKIFRELNQKYPDLIAPLDDDSAFSIRSLEATASEPVSLVAAAGDGNVGVVLRTQFMRTEPPGYIGGTALNRLTYQIARTAYESRANACGGTGYRTAQISVTYMSRSQMEGMLQASEDQRQQAREQASSNL